MQSLRLNVPIVGRSLSSLRMIPQGNVQAVSGCLSIQGWILGVPSIANTLSFALVNFQKAVLRERSNLLKERIAVEVEKRLSKELFKEISSLVREMEEKAKEAGKSPGLNLLLLYFYYLSKDDLKEVAEKARLPEPVLDDIKAKA